MSKAKKNEITKNLREIAERIYDLDCEVYTQLGSSIGRVFNHDREKCVDELVKLLQDRTDADIVRSEIGLIGNMARTIPDKQAKALCMKEYNQVLKLVMSLPDSFAAGDIIDDERAKLNEFNLRNRFGKDQHLVICISWQYGSGGIDIGFKLADKLKISYYDKEIFEAVLKRLDAEKDSLIDNLAYPVSNENPDPTAAFIPQKKLTLKQKIREFSRYHGLSKQDAVFFNQSDLLVDMASKEDFIIMGRCGDQIMTNNKIPHVSIFITAPFEQRVERAMMVHKGLNRKKAKAFLKKLDKEHAAYYTFYTRRRWGQANNYDLCINAASYGIDGAVDFIYRMLKPEK